MKIPSAYIIIFCSIWFVILFSNNPASANNDINGVQWKPIEITLHADKFYRNSFKDVELSATFTGPTGTSITLPGFWYGKNIWKIRFSPTSVGNWVWKTECNVSDKGLNNRTGKFKCIKSSTNSHGFIKISENKRHFEYADGTPFFWLGDTHWQMPNTQRISECNHPGHKGDKCVYGGQFQHLVSDRIDKGFNVWQTYIAATTGNGKHLWWSDAWSQINPERFNRILDYEIDYLSERNFTIALGIDHFTATDHIPLDDMKRVARYIVARYAAYPIVWITAQEVNAPKTNVQYWKAIAAEIRRLDGYKHPLSGHQWVVDPYTRPLGSEKWHDYFAVQGGHRGNGAQPKSYYKAYWDYSPAKPFVETEADYEQVNCGGVADDSGVRWQAYKSILCGSAGYTYGAAGIWAARWSKDDPQWKKFNTHAWYDGLSLPGSTQMKFLAQFFSGIQWWKLVPRWNDNAWGEWRWPEETVISSDGTKTYIVYFYHNDRKTGTLKNIDPKSRYVTSWFNPRNGVTTNISGGQIFGKFKWVIPEKPDKQDWIYMAQKL